ncbi:MAG: AbrB/MazE/SpoVT family DNA-binding domain-containing protein [Candidatus Poribacteria bacterium]|nr:AbrB/MazE/SpoVT family DNA-binding domain-containing protein [Candidatus Poribacteria bacterium]
MKTLSLETDYKIKLPLDWVKDLGLESGVVLEKTDDGILIRPHTAQTWDEVYAEKLKMGKPSALDLSEVSGDDLII